MTGWEPTTEGSAAGTCTVQPERAAARCVCEKSRRDGEAVGPGDLLEELVDAPLGRLLDQIAPHERFGQISGL